jgi:two-component system chemotaxis response regulator CheY
MSKKILITDDTLFMRVTLKGILGANGFTDIVEASNGEEAISQFKKHHPDLILMDITMPGMDGITATRKIREIDPKAKIVICSAMGQKEMVMEAVQAGAIDFIVKPFQTDRVIESVRKIAEAA